jgi:hypothetical protein
MHAEWHYVECHNDIILNAIILNVIMVSHHAECYYAGRHYDKSGYAECSIC